MTSNEMALMANIAVDMQKNEVNTILNKITDEIEQVKINGHIRDIECFRARINVALNIIDKYKESEDKK